MAILEKIGLEQRIKSLDDEFLALWRRMLKIYANFHERIRCLQILKMRKLPLFYRNIVATRNYFSHYKPDRKGVLEFGQMNDTINVLKALLIMIFSFLIWVWKRK